jgi:hypothetical protein
MVCKFWDKFEDNKVVTRRRKLKDRKYNDLKKKETEINNDSHSSTQKTKDWETRTQPKTGAEIMCSLRVSSFCSTSYALYVSHVKIRRQIMPELQVIVVRRYQRGNQNP